ncbi:hypothetical protein HPB47_016819, partial [Ixodes persulcatus]
FSGSPILLDSSFQSFLSTGIFQNARKWSLKWYTPCFNMAKFQVHSMTTSSRQVKSQKKFLHFVLNLCLEELPSWAEMVLLSLTSKVVTLRALGTFLWKLLIS